VACAPRALSLSECLWLITQVELQRSASRALRSAHPSRYSHDDTSAELGDETIAEAWRNFATCCERLSTDGVCFLFHPKSYLNSQRGVRRIGRVLDAYAPPPASTP
jgi:hypothetical protein